MLEGPQVLKWLTSHRTCPGFLVGVKGGFSVHGSGFGAWDSGCGVQSLNLAGKMNCKTGSQLSDDNGSRVKRH